MHCSCYAAVIIFRIHPKGMVWDILDIFLSRCASKDVTHGIAADDCSWKEFLCRPCAIEVPGKPALIVWNAFTYAWSIACTHVQKKIVSMLVRTRSMHIIAGYGEFSPGLPESLRMKCVTCNRLAVMDPSHDKRNFSSWYVYYKARAQSFHTEQACTQTIDSCT